MDERKERKMTELQEQLLTLLLSKARDLTEPELTNVEYVRGQAELICDFMGLPMDEFKETVMDVISHGLTVPMGVDHVRNVLWMEARGE